MERSSPIWVDDRSAIYRRGIMACLQGAGYDIAGESAGLPLAPQLPRSSVLIFDVAAAGIDRRAAIARRCDVRLVGLVREDSQTEPMPDQLTAGLSAVLVLRGLTRSRLLGCVRAVSEGGGVITPEALSSMVGGARAHPDGRAGDLTERELEVLRLLADGASTRELAQRLSYSERTVKNIVHDLLAKLGCRTRAHAVARAVRRGVI
jgi:DNA-binding NarL/FixJ family response regulator